MGVGVTEVEVAAGGGLGATGGLGASEVAILLTHAVLPFSSRIRSQSPLTSRIFREVPFLALPITL